MNKEQTKRMKEISGLYGPRSIKKAIRIYTQHGIPEALYFCFEHGFMKESDILDHIFSDQIPDGAAEKPRKENRVIPGKEKEFLEMLKSFDEPGPAGSNKSKPVSGKPAARKPVSGKPEARKPVSGNIKFIYVLK